MADARLACHSVSAAVSLERRSEAPGLDVGARNRLAARAMATLLKATQPAAEATSLDGSWNPLMTTINESERVPFVDVEPALTRLCQVADSSSPYEGA